MSVEKLGEYEKIETLSPDVRICIQCGDIRLNIGNNGISCSNCSARFQKKLVAIEGETT